MNQLTLPTRISIVLILSLNIIVGASLFYTSANASSFKRKSISIPSGELPTPNSVLAIPASLISTDVSLKAKPVSIPLELKIPTLGIETSMLGVGTTNKKAMAAPVGKADDKVWQQAFWYRGSAIPGDLSTALIAGHVNGTGGIDGVFAHLESIKAGDPIIIHDTRTELDVTFRVDEIKTYALKDMKEKSILNDIYGTGPPSGNLPQASADGLAHLTLITCAGTFVKTTHDHRFVVFATRVQ
jgi:sortase (surface protein transpeptidase)